MHRNVDFFGNLFKIMCIYKSEVLLMFFLSGGGGMVACENEMFGYFNHFTLSLGLYVFLIFIYHLKKYRRI